MPECIEINLKIHGQVHGVGFRYDTSLQARDLRLVGFVRNLPDGTVEIVAQGPKENLEKLVDWANHGPRSASVEKVGVQFSRPKTKYADFKIL